MCAIIHFGTDGWRARVDEDFTADNVARIADAVGELWQKTNPGKTVYIGFDTRPLAREFAELAAGVLAAHGLDAVLASRPVPTPALTWAAAYDGEACGALMVTGSHHPQGYLCLKIRMGDGSTANQDVIEELEETMAPEPMGIEGNIVPRISFLTICKRWHRLSMPKPSVPRTCAWLLTPWAAQLGLSSRLAARAWR